MNTPTCFIVIDDDVVNNMLCCIVIEGITNDPETLSFTVAEEAFEYILNKYSGAGNKNPTILFLDINMPTWSGWDFLDNFETIDERIKSQIKIYMLSSSVSINDEERAKENRNVTGYITKPLGSVIVSEIVLNSKWA